MAQRQPVHWRLPNEVVNEFLHFLERKDHVHVNLASRRFYYCSIEVFERYPGRVCERIYIRGLEKDEQTGRYRTNELRFLTDIPAEIPIIEPPKYIAHFSSVMISDFIGPQIVQFLRVSTRLLDGCTLQFDEFYNFVQIHSTDFIILFFALFPPNRVDKLFYVSESAATLFNDHPAMFSEAKLIIKYFFGAFPLECLLNWLYLDGQRFLKIIFLWSTTNQRDLAKAFVEHIRKDFRGALLACPFKVHIKEYGWFELAPFEERNVDTGERLTFDRGGEWFYKLERKLYENSEGEEEEEAREDTSVVIHGMVQGDIEYQNDKEKEKEDE